ncbi:MAG: hypothetical protein GX802_03455 [Clostridiales bacterium]|jgi:hypothetical protein|nr:hypothetical protein [Clostridiales bacterium]
MQKKLTIEKNRVYIMLVCILLIVASLFAITYTLNIMLNKWSKTQYEKIDETDKAMLQAVSDYLNETQEGAELNIPIAFVRNYGVWRGNGYLFNHSITEYKGTFGLSSGTFATEILLPNELKLPGMYRLASMEPPLGAFLFPSDNKIVDLYGVETYVICYDANSLNDGTFIALLARALKNT